MYRFGTRYRIAYTCSLPGTHSINLCTCDDRIAVWPYSIRYIFTPDRYTDWYTGIGGNCKEITGNVLNFNRLIVLYREEMLSSFVATLVFSGAQLGVWGNGWREFILYIAGIVFFLFAILIVILFLHECITSLNFDYWAWWFLRDDPRFTVESRCTYALTFFELKNLLVHDRVLNQQFCYRKSESLVKKSHVSLNLAIY